MAILLGLCTAMGNISAEETWRSYVDMKFEDNFEQEFTWGKVTGNSPVAIIYPDSVQKWRGHTNKTDSQFSTGVADPAGGTERMLRLSMAYSASEGTTAKSFWMDNDPVMTDESAGGIRVLETSYYLDGAESFVDKGYLQCQLLQGSTSSQFVPYVMKPDGFYRTAMQTTPTTACELPRNEWFKVMIVLDYDNNTWYTNLITANGTVTKVTNGTYPWKDSATGKGLPIGRVRSTFSDTVSEAHPSSWLGIGYIRYYQLDFAKGYAGGEATGGKAGLGKTVGVTPQFTGDAPEEVSYQWCRVPTETVYNSPMPLPGDISGETAAEYTPTVADINNFLFVKILIKGNSLYAGWPDQQAGIFPEEPMPAWAVDADPFVMDFASEDEGTAYRNANGHFYNSAGNWNTFATGDFSAVTRKDAGNWVKDGALEIRVDTPNASNGFWMWEKNAFGGMAENVVQIEQKFFIPSGGAFTADSSDYLTHDNRFGKDTKAILKAYTLKSGYIMDGSGNNQYAPIPYDEWFALRVVYFMQEGYSDVVMIREDGTKQVLLSGKKFNDSVTQAIQSGGYRKSRSQVSMNSTDKTHFYFGDFTVKSSESYQETPWVSFDGDAASASTVCADYTGRTPQPCLLSIGQYRNGRLLAVKTVTSEGSGAEALKLSVTLSGLDIQSGDALKAFLWNGVENLKPLVVSAVQTVS